MRVRRRRLRGASASGTRMTTSPWSPTENGCTEWARCERRSVGMPSLSNRLFTTTASARSQRCTATRLRESRGSGGRVGKRITFPRRVIGQSIVRRRRTRGRARAGPISPRASRGSDVQSGPGPRTIRTRGAYGEVRVFQRHARGRDRPPRAPRRAPRPPALRAGARPGRLRGQGHPQLSSLPSHQLAARGDARAGRPRMGAPLGLAARAHRRHPPPPERHDARHAARRVPRDGAARRERDRGDARHGPARLHGLLLRAPLGHARLRRPPGWRGDYLPYRFAVEDVRPLVADRSHVPPSGHTIFKLPGCYICIFTVRSVEKEGMWLPFFHKNLDYLETLGYHFGDFFSGGGVVREGMVTLHPVGLPHGPKPASLKAFLDGRNPSVHHEVGIMADLANPTQVSEFALSLGKPDYMQSWAAYTTDPRFAHRGDRLAEVRALAERHAAARDELRPKYPERE